MRDVSGWALPILKVQTNEGTHCVHEPVSHNTGGIAYALENTAPVIQSITAITSRVASCIYKVGHNTVPDEM